MISHDQLMENPIVSIYKWMILRSTRDNSHGAFQEGHRLCSAGVQDIVGAQASQALWLTVDETSNVHIIWQCVKTLYPW